MIFLCYSWWYRYKNTRAKASVNWGEITRLWSRFLQQQKPCAIPYSRNMLYRWTLSTINCFAKVQYHMDSSRRMKNNVYDMKISLLVNSFWVWKRLFVIPVGLLAYISLVQTFKRKTSVSHLTLTCLNRIENEKKFVTSYPFQSSTLSILCHSQGPWPF